MKRRWTPTPPQIHHHRRRHQVRPNLTSDQSPIRSIRPPRLLIQYYLSSGADAGGAGENKPPPHPLDFNSAPPPQPVREDYVQNAVKFLSHPKVRGSAVVYRRSFLQNKGLTNDEIDEAFRRVPVRSQSLLIPLASSSSLRLS